MSGKNFMSYGDADTILTEFSNDIKSRVSTKANQGLTAQQIANAKANIDIDKVPNVATNDQTPTFLEESSRTNIASGDKLSLIFGKIKKFFSDLKAVAFSGSYNDLSNKPTIPTALSQLTTDSTHRVVTDTEKTTLASLQYHTISNIDSPWDSGVTALTITFYRVSDVSQHSGTMPFGNSSFVLCTSHSSKNYGMQFAFSDNPECFAARSLSSGVWTAWKKIGDSGTKLGSSVSLNNYSSSTNKYTVPNDGYVMVYAGSGTGFSVSFDSVNSGTEVIKISSNAPYTRQSIFVKKGMKVYGYAIGGSSYQFLYYPLR